MSEPALWTLDHEPGTVVNVRTKFYLILSRQKSSELLLPSILYVMIRGIHQFTRKHLSKMMGLKLTFSDSQFQIVNNSNIIQNALHI